MIAIWRISFNKPGCAFSLIGTVFVILALAFIISSVNKSIREQGYQSGQCMITGRHLQHEISTEHTTNNNGSTSTKDVDVYAPHFTYIVHTADGRNYTASGYDGSNNYTSDRASQQAIVDQYKTEKSYQCWYNRQPNGGHSCSPYGLVRDRVWNPIPAVRPPLWRYRRFYPSRPPWTKTTCVKLLT